MAKALVNYVGNLSSEQGRVDSVLNAVSSGLANIDAQLNGLKSAWTTSGQDLDTVITDFNEIKSSANEIQTQAESVISEIQNALSALDAIGIVGGK